MIKRIGLGNLTHDELSTFSTRIIKAVKETASVNIGIINKILLILITFCNDFIKALNKTNKSEHTKILKSLDKIRDDAFRALRDAIYACTWRLNESYRMHAKKLYEIIRLHGLTLYKENYQVQSAKSNSLIKDFDTPECQASLAALQLAEWYEEMKQSHGEFETAFYNKAYEKNREEFVALLEVRNNLTKNITELLNRIDSDAKYSDEAANYIDLVNTINNIVTETSTLSKSRRTRKENTEEEINPELN
ncbi:MAG: hypothetical protein GY756_13045 [bacterium]|nr:hypothetical protein [bacterium]